MKDVNEYFPTPPQCNEICQPSNAFPHLKLHIEQGGEVQCPWEEYAMSRGYK